MRGGRFHRENGKKAASIDDDCARVFLRREDGKRG